MVRSASKLSMYYLARKPPRKKTKPSSPPAHSQDSLQKTIQAFQAKKILRDVAAFAFVFLTHRIFDFSMKLKKLSPPAISKALFENAP